VKICEQRGVSWIRDFIFFGYIFFSFVSQMKELGSEVEGDISPSFCTRVFFKLSWACWIGLCTLGPHKPTHFCKGNACDWSVSKIAQKKLKFWHLLLPTILYGLS
jgi:hypothetical protein